jgi:hypothetical protein
MLSLLIALSVSDMSQRRSGIRISRAIQVFLLIRNGDPGTRDISSKGGENPHRIGAKTSIHVLDEVQYMYELIMANSNLTGNRRSSQSGMLLSPTIVLIFNVYFGTYASDIFKL